MEGLLNGLDPKQAEAVKYCLGPELVIAGAGSGKTRVLTSKIAWLIGACGVKPHKILALTFTNKAAREMLSRVKLLVGDDLHGMQVSTFHSYGLRFLRTYPSALEHLGRNSSFNIFDRSDQRAVVRAEARRLGMDIKPAEAGAILERISRTKSACDPATLEPTIDERFRDLYFAYEESLASANAFDFDDLMIAPLHVMLTMPDVLERERARVEWTLVDEYQDVNVPQYELLRSLAGHTGRVMAVGDPDQSIYGWRGADMSLIMNFEHDFPGAHVVVLDQNYRSTGFILDAANAVIKHNTNRYEKDLWTGASQGRPVKVMMARNDDEESRFIADEIERLADDGYRYSEMAILYRMNALSRTYEQTLLERGIPHRIVRGLAFFDRREVKDAVALLRLAWSPRDFASLERVANVPPRGIGKKGVETLTSYLSLAEGEPRDVWREMRDHPPLKGKADVRGLASMMLAFLEDGTLSGSIELLLNDFGYREFIAGEYPDDFEDRLDNVMELLSIATDDGTVPEVLSQISLFTDADQNSMQDGVGLSTLHAAKGLEFPVVFLVGFEEGVFPSMRSTDEGGMEEERRLCYVGMTRARERLYITGAASRLLFGSFRRAPFSRFLSELPRLCIELDDRTNGTNGTGGAGDARRGSDRRRWVW